MKRKPILPIATAALLLQVLAACTPSTPPPTQPAQQVEITANDTMKFSLVAFDVQRGAPVSITFKNVGTAPKASMGHNLIVLKQGVAPAAFAEAGTMYASANYIAPEMKDKVLAATKLLGPGESDTITFNAPGTPGNYNFLCAFPGHFGLGMKGVMTVH